MYYTINSIFLSWYDATISMPKSHSRFTCQQCGFVSAQFFGRCPECDAWNSLVESVELTVKDHKNSRSSSSAVSAKPVLLSEIKQQSKERMKTTISELDHVLGGGLVPGQVVLLAGEPGVGKSTLLLQVVKSIGKNAGINPTASILYASGEESPEQISLRATRLGFTKEQSKALLLYPETNLENILQVISYQLSVISNTNNVHIKNQVPKTDFKLLIIDSIQTMWSDKLTGAAGSVGQVR
jgi:DNA repair protein RadA/Sms